MTRLPSFVSLPKVAVAAALVAAALGGCASFQTAPLSKLEDGYVYYRSVLFRSPLIVTRIDSESNVFAQPLIAPGEHEVVFAASAPFFHRETVAKAYKLRIAPCTRYYVAAQRHSSLEQDWDLVIEKAEPIGGCSPDKEIQKAGLPADVATWSRDVSPIVGIGRHYPS